MVDTRKPVLIFIEGSQKIFVAEKAENNSISIHIDGDKYPKLGRELR